MPNQRAIAKAAGVNQATVSLALRNSPLVSQKTRERIHRIAEDLGYQPNSYVSSLMAHIRSGRPPRNRGCIALLVAAPEHSLDRIETYALQWKGMAERAAQLGFSTETLYVDPDAGMSLKRIDTILQAQGIRGLIFTAPNLLKISPRPLSLAHYAMASMGFSWSEMPTHRVAASHWHNVQMAFRKLQANGYRRIGMCLPRANAAGGPARVWKSACLLLQDEMPVRNRIPMFVGRPGVVPITKFRTWLQKYKPDALVSLLGHEIVWLEKLGMTPPEDIAMVCLNRPIGSQFSGIEENHEVLGQAAIDLVATQIMSNSHGLPPHPKLILIEGTWVDGETMRFNPKTAIGGDEMAQDAGR